MSEQTRGLTAEQLEMLLRPLNGNRVQQHKGQSHLEAWDDRKWLTRIFGFGGWSDTILDLALVHESVWPVRDGNGEPVPGKNRCTAVYRVTLRLTIKDVHGGEINHWDDVATGEAVNQASVGDAHDLAIKAAVSQAIKRCAVNLGDQFGLSLYNKGSVDAVVIKTLGHPYAAPADASVPDDAPVVGGELGEGDEEHFADAIKVAGSGPGAENIQAAPAAAETPRQVEQPAPSAQPEVEMISDGQRKAVFAMLTQKHGKVPDEERYAGLSKFAGRTVTSLNEYTHDEAKRLLDTLSKQPDHQPAPAKQAADGNENFRQAEALLRTEQGQESQQLEADLQDAIESSENKTELTATMTTVMGHRDAGRISPWQFTRLAEAADKRAAAGRQRAVAMAAAARRAA